MPYSRKKQLFERIEELARSSNDQGAATRGPTQRNRNFPLSSPERPAQEPYLQSTPVNSEVVRRENIYRPSETSGSVEELSEGPSSFQSFPPEGIVFETFSGHLSSEGSAADVWLCQRPLDLSISSGHDDLPNTSQSSPNQIVKKVMRVVPDYFRNSDRNRNRDLLVALRKHFNDDFRLWWSLDHRNIVKLYLVAPDKLTLFEEYCEGGSLREYCKKELSFDQWIRALRDVLNGINFLHAQNPPVVHGCINPGKIYVTQDGTAKLGEFGLSRLVVGFPHLAPSIRVDGRSRWMGPECFDDNSTQPRPLETPSDIWAFGCTLFEIITGRVPYYQYKYDTQVLLKIKSGLPPGNLEQLWDRLPNSNMRVNQVNIRPLAAHLDTTGAQVLGGMQSSDPKSEQYEGTSRTYMELTQELITQCWLPVRERPSSQSLLRQFKQLKIPLSLKVSQHHGSAELSVQTSDVFLPFSEAFQDQVQDSEPSQRSDSQANSQDPTASEVYAHPPTFKEAPADSYVGSVVVPKRKRAFTSLSKAKIDDKSEKDELPIQMLLLPTTNPEDITASDEKHTALESLGEERAPSGSGTSSGKEAKVNPKGWKDSGSKSRFKAKLKGMLEGDEGPGKTLTPTPGTKAPPHQAGWKIASHPHSPSTAAALDPTGTGSSPRVKSGGWDNLKRSMNSLNRMATLGGLGPLKAIIEGLVDCIEIYEDAARDRQAYVSLRTDLGVTFDQLQKYIALSPTVEMDISGNCDSMQKEIDCVKAQQTRLRIIRLKEAEDEDTVLGCYKRVRDRLKNLMLSLGISTSALIEQHAMDDRLRKLAPSLAHYSSGNAVTLRRGPCMEGTRTSVLAGMYKWIVGPSAGKIYWMNGMAGTGKTTIAHSLCEGLDGVRMLGASFFCSRSLPECRDAGKIIPSIAYQLAQRYETFQHALCQVMESNPNAHVGGPALQFELLIAKPLSDVKVQATFSKNTVVVIDALDECEDTTHTQRILGVLLTKSKNLPVKFVVSSRPEPALCDRMEKHGTWIDNRVALHELDSREIKADIMTYLKAKLAQIRPLESDIERLAERAGVLFIYAATAVRYIGYDDLWRGYARLRAILGVSEQQRKAQTEEIDQLYGTILRATAGDMKQELTAADRDITKLVLDTVIYAQEPLTVATLNQLLQLNDVDRVQAAIRSLRVVLYVTRPDKTITTLHASFPDYLLDSTRSGAWYCNAATQHCLLARRCFECIRDAKPQFNICQLESSYVFDKKVVGSDTRVQEFIPSELRYSCQYWSYHLSAAEPDATSDLISLLSQFLTTHLLLWMEVRNLTKTMSAILGELAAAKRWATRHGLTRDVIDLLSDAWRFASTFISNPVSQSTPHLYISMLPLLPLYSPIRKHYLGRFRGVIGVEGTALDQRQDAVLAQWKFELHVECVAWSPDGTRVAIGGHTGDVGHIYLLDASSGTLLLDLSHGEGATVQSIAFSPDSTRLVSGGEDGIIRIWDVTNGQLILHLPKAHNSAICSVLFWQDEFHIISASADTTIRTWDTHSGTSPYPLDGHTDSVTCTAISSDGAFLVSGSKDRTVRLWDMKARRLLATWGAWCKGEINVVALSPDNSRVVSGSTDGKILVSDMETYKTVLGPLQFEGTRLNSISISPDGTVIASTSDAEGVQIWDAASWRIVSQIGPFSEVTYSKTWATYSPDGTCIMFTRSDGTIQLLDINTQNAAAYNPLPAHTRPITSLDISPDCRHVVSGSWDCTLRVWDLTQGTLILGPLLGHNDFIYMARFSPDGSRIVSCAADSTIRQWDAQSGAVHGTPITVASGGDWGVISAIYSPNGALIASLTFEGELSVWDSSNGQSVLGPIAATSQSGGGDTDFSPNGSTVIAGYADGSISAWDVQTGQLVYSHEGYVGSDVSSLAFSLDGLYYAQSFEDGKISLRSIHTGEQMPRTFEGHTRYTTSVRFSSDSTRLVSGSDDGTVHVWNVETGQSLLGPLSGHTGLVQVVAFSPDGRHVVSASDDGAIRVWDVQPQTPLAKDEDVKHTDWEMDKDGWVVSGESQRLFWVPNDLRASLMRPRNTALLSRDGYMRLNFEGSRVGEAWSDCWRNI